MTVYIDDVARRDREFESWQPRRSPDEGAFRRQSQIDVYSSLARSIMDGRRARAGVVSGEVVAATAQAAGIEINGDLDAHLAEDALTDALARYYESRAEDLRRDDEVGASNGFIRFLRRLLGNLEPQLRHGSGAVEADDYLRQRNPGTREGTSTAPSGQTGAGAVLTDLAAKAGDKAGTNDAGEKAREPIVAGGTGHFGKLWDEFVQTKIDIRKDWKPSRRSELLSTCRLWIWIVGDVALSECGSDQIRKFHDSYLQLPEDYVELRKNGRNMHSPSAVIAAAKLRQAEQAKRNGTPPAPYVRVNAKTFNKHLGNLKAFLIWAPAAKMRPAAEADPTKGFHIAVNKSTAAVRAERNMAPVEAIRELFESPYWTGRSSTYFMTKPGDIIIRDAMYWVPLIIAFHGLRREEISQLRRRHIKSERFRKGKTTILIWYFDLTQLDLNLKEPDAGSPRRVPFHREFEKLGFLEDKIRGLPDDELVFPELSDDNAHAAFGESVGKRFGNYVGNIKFSDGTFNEVLTLQAMRHTVRTLLDNTDAKEVYVDELLGHESEGRRSEGRRYRKGIDLQNLKKAIDLLVLPIDTDRLRSLALSKQHPKINS